MRQNSMGRELQFENDLVRVWKTVVSPNEPIPSQSKDSVFISLNGGTVIKELASGESQSFDLEPHKAYWQGSESQNPTPKKVNRSSKPLEIMVVEMKTPQNTPWPSIPID